jgi:hypothetical protein
VAEPTETTDAFDQGDVQETFDEVAEMSIEPPSEVTGGKPIRGAAKGAELKANEAPSGVFGASLGPTASSTAWKGLFLLFLAGAGYLVWYKWTRSREERELERQMGGTQVGPPDVSDGFPQPPNDGRQYDWVEGQGWVPVGLQIADPSQVAPGAPYGGPGHSNADRLSQAALEHKQQPSLTDPRDPNGQARQAREQAGIAMSQAGMNGPAGAGFQLRPGGSKGPPAFLTGLNRG